ncbi:divergent protein kinase domain 2B-like [Huso huso]|uniref:Divergent protein kinase domain 2B-like n=1 Tax=Huso huso TaxID=61971 RepID=A0ABR0ZL19_HUSHU
MGFQRWRAEALWKVLLQFGVLSLYCWDIGRAVTLSPTPGSQTQYKPVFLGLDKCNACIGISICKKFFKEKIRPVVISRLLTKYKHDVSDTNICTSAVQGVTCSIENILRSTKRFQKWTSSNFLTPDLVQVFISPMTDYRITGMSSLV